MTVLPVIERELRSQARLPFTYGLRVLGVAALVLVSLVYSLNAGLTPDAGGYLFGWLNFALFTAIWFMVPLIACDCISRERREGTIGLLFLTPLRARDIVLAKGLVHGLRAMSLWLAVIPVLTIPFVLGGLSRREVLIAALFNFCFICLALAAGLLASAVSKNWLRAQILAYLLGLAFVSVFVGVTGQLFESTVAFKASSYSYTGATTILSPTGGVSRPHYAPGLAGPSFYYGTRSYQYLTMNRETLPIVGFLAMTDVGGCWGPMLATMSPKGQSSWLVSVGWLAGLSFVFLLTAIQVAAWQLRHVWQEEPPSARQVWLREKFCRPVVGVNFLRRWLRRKLECNPIGWLEQRTWSGRLVMWGWFAVMVSLYSTVLGRAYGYGIFYRLQNFLAWTLLIGLASSAAGSFQRERETGVMELLLVSPMKEGRIIGGRIRALWGQFLPALILLMIVWIYLDYWSSRAAYGFESGQGSGWISFYCVAFLTLPVIGLYFSLRLKKFLSAFLITLFTGLVLPLVWASLFRGVTDNSWDLNQMTPNQQSQIGEWEMICDFLGSGLFVNILQIVIAIFLTRRLLRNLRYRNFAFSREVT